MLSRRTFVSWLSGVGAALGLGARARLAQATLPESALPPLQPSSLDATMVRRVAEVVLPVELGDAGFDRVIRGFTRWVADYRPGVELVHPYGSTTLRQAAESPAIKWRAQLGALETEARTKHQRAFSALTREQRRELVTAALAAGRATRLPEPLEADHVALALVAWYFASPDAIDLCYGKRIGKNQCRPLVNSSREPLPLLGGGRGTGDGERHP